MVDITSSNYNNIVSKVVSRVEFSQVVCLDVENIISVSLLRLTKHVFSVHIEVHVFNKSFLISVVVIFVLIWDLFLEKFKLISIKSTVGD